MGLRLHWLNPLREGKTPPEKEQSTASDDEAAILSFLESVEYFFGAITYNSILFQNGATCWGPISG